jgi:hypothetical protein
MSLSNGDWEERYRALEKEKAKLKAELASVREALAEAMRKLSPLEGMRLEPGITDASKELVGELGKMIYPGSRWRMAALLLTYKMPHHTELEVNIAHGVAAQELTSVSDVNDLIQLAKSLRALAEKVDGLLDGRERLADSALTEYFRAKRGEKAAARGGGQ